MAFNLFQKDSRTGKSAIRPAVSETPEPKAPSTRTLRRDGPTTRTLRRQGPSSKTFSENEAWNPQVGVIEVVEETFSSPSLENAALMFAHGNASAATAALRHAIESAEGKQPFVWWCLFDLLARAGERVAFDDLALRYVVEFERSAPAWDDMAWPSGGEANAAGQPGADVPKGRILLRGDLTDTHAPVVATLIETSRRKPPNLPQRLDIDVGELRSASDICGTLVAGALAALRRKGVHILFRGLNPAVNRLALHVAEHKANCPRGVWYLTLELMQWADRQSAFEDLAVDFAVTFGVSPPSWEALSAAQRAVIATTPETPEDAATDAASGDEWIRLQGELHGANAPSLQLIEPSKVTTNPVMIEMSRVQRVDFACAGALANAIRRLMAQAIDVKLVNASPIIQALLQLTGTPAHLFTRVNPRR
ncbi:MAG: STAS domain-containing protein [Casimicrobiaceae bacterium]